MAFAPAKLTKVCNLLTLVAPTDPTPGYFIYTTRDDSVATVTTAGYFNPTANLLVEGAIIRAVCSDGARDIRILTSDGVGAVTFEVLIGAVS